MSSVYFIVKNQVSLNFRALWDLISADLLRRRSCLLVTTRGSKDPEQLLVFLEAQRAGVRAMAGDSA